MLDFINLAQAFGIVSFIIGIYTFTHKNDLKLKINMTCLHCCQIIHFLLLDAPNAMIANIVNAIRTVVSIKFNARWIGIFFILLNIALGAPSVSTWYNVLPIIGAVIGTFSVFYMSGIKMRLGFITGASCWVINNIIIGSIGGVLLESLIIIINLITIYRIYLDNKQTRLTNG